MKKNFLLRFKRKIKIEEFLLLLIFVFVSWVAIFLGAYTVGQYNLQRSSYAFYSPDALAFRASGVEDLLNKLKAYMLDFQQTEPKKSLTLLRKETNLVYLAYTKGETTTVPTFTGRYLTYPDFFDGQNYAVVGADFTASTDVSVKTQKGITTLSYRNVDYKVIGRMQQPYTSIANSSACLSLFSDVKYSPIYPFIVDSLDKKTIEKAYADIEALVTQAGGKFSPVELPPSSTSITQFFRVELLNFIVILFAVFAVVLSTVPITLYWAKRRKKDVAVKRFLGFGGGLITFNVYCRFLIIFNIAFFAGYGSSWILYWMQIIEPPSLLSSEVMTAYLFALAFNLVTATVPLVKLMQIEPGDALRRDG